MALTASEQSELDSLNKKAGVVPASSGLSLDEQKELDSLNMRADAASEAQKSFPTKALETVGAVGKFVDSYTGAPTRAAIGAVQSGKGISGAAGAFGHQFGENPELAPTGQDIARKAGISDKPIANIPDSQIQDAEDAAQFDPDMAQAAGLFRTLKNTTRSGAAGVMVDIAADPTNIIPAVAAGKRLGKAGVEAAKLASSGIAKGSVAAIDAATKTNVASKVVEGVKEGAQAATESLGKVFSPKRAEDFEDMVRIAKREGIDPAILPESVEFGQNSFISRASRAKAEGVTGQKKLEQYAEAQAQLQNALDKKISKISGGAPRDAVEAGDVIRRGYDEGVEKFFQDIDVTHDQIIKTQPGLYVNRAERAELDAALNGVDKFAKGRVLRGITKTQQEQGAQLLNAVAAIRRSNGSYKQTVEALRDIGEVAFKTTGSAADIPADVEKMRDIYFKINDALVNTVRKDVNPEWASELVKNQADMSAFINRNKNIKQVIKDAQVAPERVFKSLVLNGDTQKIEALKGVLSPEQFQQVKGAVLENLIKREADGSFNLKTFYSAMRNKRTILESVFEPSELVEIGELVKLGDRFGSPVLSSSGTGASNVFKDVTGSIRDSVFNDAVLEGMKERARNPVGLMAPSAVGPEAAAAEGLAAPGRFAPARKGLTIPRRSRIEQGAKAAQSLSTQGRPGRGVATDE